MECYSKTFYDSRIKKRNDVYHIFQNSCFIYSMCHGYLELHTSGYADKKTMQKMEKLLRPDKTFVIHTDANNEGKKTFQTYEEIAIDKEYEI